MHLHHYVYRITNKVNNKFYIGIHSTNNLNDEYMGSGVAIKFAIKKYGIENFVKEIISIHETRDSALVEEKQLVTAELVKNDQCYNLKTGGSSGFIYSEDWINQVSERAKKNHIHTINSKASQEKRAIANRKRALSGEYSTIERREKISKSMLKQSSDISLRVKANWSNLEHAEYRKKKMKEGKANSPTMTCVCCGLQMKANLNRHMKAKHPHFEITE